MSNFYYYSHIDDNQNLIITQTFADVDEIADAITIPKMPNVSYQTESIIFDTEGDAYSFIKEQREQARNSLNLFFQLEGYKIIDQHYIELFYTSHVSNS